MNDILSAIMADPNVSPEMKRVLAPVKPLDGDHVLALRRAAYVSAIIKFDHQFEFSSDQRVWQAGRNEIKRLRAERAAVDADGALWRKHMHEAYRFEVMA
jgi:hypothetical protein